MFVNCSDWIVRLAASTLSTAPVPGALVTAVLLKSAVSNVPGPGLADQFAPVPHNKSVPLPAVQMKFAASTVRGIAKRQGTAANVANRKNEFFTALEELRV